MRPCFYSLGAMAGSLCRGAAVLTGCLIVCSAAAQPVYRINASTGSGGACLSCPGLQASISADHAISYVSPDCRTYVESVDAYRVFRAAASVGNGSIDLQESLDWVSIDTTCGSVNTSGSLEFHDVVFSGPPGETQASVSLKVSVDCTIATQPESAWDLAGAGPGARFSGGTPPFNCGSHHYCGGLGLVQLTGATEVAALNVPHTVRIDLSSGASGSHFFPGGGSQAVQLHLGTPVFDLPPGFTVNSPSAGIYDNQFLLVGDLNCDGAVNNFDIDAFIMALLDPLGHSTLYPNCNRLHGDVNRDGVLNNFDIDAFVNCIVASVGQCP